MTAGNAKIKTELKSGAAVKPPPKPLTEVEVDALIGRVQVVLDGGGEISVDDLRLLLDALKWVMHLSERLAANDLTIHKLKKLLGMVSSSEKSRDLPIGSNTEGPKSGSHSGTRGTPPKVTPHGKSHADDFPSATVEHHAHVDLVKGCVCPDCHRGKLYKFEPTQFVRISGHAPLTATVHVVERLRCNLCQLTFKAPLPPAVTEDGEAGQRFGYSATAAVALLRYGAGMPHYRQQTLQNMLGVPVSTSTLWDLSESLANHAKPVFDLLRVMASSAWLFYSDDTSNRILSQGTVTKKKRGSNKDIERSGVNTSGVAAALSSGQMIVLYQTGINHAGEAIDAILRLRPPDLPPFLHMSDGLTSNVPTGDKGVQLDCNSHLRRQFADLAIKFPGEVDFIVETYRNIYRNDHEAAGMTPQQRLEFHQERSLPLMKAMIDWGNQALAERLVEPNSPLGKAIKYMLKREEGLMGFCRVAGAPIDNNLLERKIKLVVLHRKNSLFYKEPAGAKVGDMLMSIIATAAEARINVFEYLIHLQRYSKEVKSDPSKHLPWNYDQTAPTGPVQ